MALFYRSSTSHTANYGGSNNSDPSIHVAEWFSYQLTDWANRLGPSYAAMKYNHDNWDAYGSYTATNNMYLQLQLRGADYRADNDSGLHHGFTWRMAGDTSNGYFYWYSVNFEDRQYTAGSGGGLGRWYETKTHQIISDRYHLRPTDFAQPRLAQVMFSDTPGKRFFAWDIFSQAGVIHEAVDLANTGKGYDPGWVYSYSNYVGIAHRKSSDSNAPNYAPTITSAFPSNAVGETSTSFWRGIIDKVALRDYYGRYFGTTSNTAYSEYTLPRGWKWTVDDRTFVSWTDYCLIETTGLIDG